MDDGSAVFILMYCLFLVCAVFCIRNGRWILLALGLFFPILWLIGALLGKRSDLV